MKSEDSVLEDFEKNELKKYQLQYFFPILLRVYLFDVYNISRRCCINAFNNLSPQKSPVLTALPKWQENVL
jgi:hypothetical protein